MAKKTLTKDRNSTWSVDDNGGTWKVAVNVLIKTQNAPGILEEEGSSNNRIIVNGDIRSVNARCIDLTGGVGTEVTVGQQSTLKGFIGVAAHGDNQVVNNRGTIIAESIAISSGFIESRVVNDGSLVAEAGILALADDAVIINGKRGEIDAMTGITTACDTSLKIVNKGEISGSSTAILISDGFTEIGTAHVINEGKISGIIQLGNGDDIFDTRKGTMDSVVKGGDGNDTFYVAKKSIEISEQNGDGSDTVISSASFKLSAHVENLTLVGGKDLRGDGTNGGNIINGNKGDNRLFGHDGVDLLNGKAGDDQLNGGDDGVLDLFIFNRGTGDDVVSGFEDGIDLVMLGNYDGIDGMEDFDVAAAGSDTRLILKDGDTVLIKGLLVANFSDDDVVFDIV